MKNSAVALGFNGGKKPLGFVLGEEGDGATRKREIAFPRSTLFYVKILFSHVVVEGEDVWR